MSAKHLFFLIIPVGNMKELVYLFMLRQKGNSIMLTMHWTLF